MTKRHRQRERPRAFHWTSDCTDLGPCLPGLWACGKYRPHAPLQSPLTGRLLAEVTCSPSGMRNRTAQRSAPHSATPPSDADWWLCSSQTICKLQWCIQPFHCIRPTRLVGEESLVLLRIGTRHWEVLWRLELIVWLLSCTSSPALSKELGARDSRDLTDTANCK